MESRHLQREDHMTDFEARNTQRAVPRRRCILAVLRQVTAVTSFALGAVIPVRVGAQSTTPAKDAMRLPAPPTMEIPAQGSRAAPAITIGTPSGFGAEWRDAMVGFGYQATTRLHNRPDGVAAFAFGVGDADKLAALEVAIASYGTARTCCRGGMSFKAHHTFPWDLGVAVGWENGAVWGPINSDPAEVTDAGRSVYGVASKVFLFRGQLANPYRALTVSAGVGNGRFRTEDDIIAGKKNVNAFGSVSYRFSRPVSVVADWTGQDLGAGVSWLPFHDYAFVVMPGVVDLTTKPRFVLGTALGFDYAAMFR